MRAKARVGGGVCPFAESGESGKWYYAAHSAKEAGASLVGGLDDQPAFSRSNAMSHHLDSPIARQDIRLDITDL